MPFASALQARFPLIRR